MVSLLKHTLTRFTPTKKPHPNKPHHNIKITINFMDVATGDTEGIKGKSFCV